MFRMTTTHSSNKCTPHTIDFIVRDTDPELQVVEDDITKDLARIGITVNVKFLDSESYIEAEKHGTYNMLFTRTWVSVFYLLSPSFLLLPACYWMAAASCF